MTQRLVKAVVLCAWVGPSVLVPCASSATVSLDAAPVLAQMRAAAGGDRWNDVTSLHFTTRTKGGGQDVAGERWEDVSTGRYVATATYPTYVSQEGFDGVTLWQRARSGIAYGAGDVNAGLVAADEAFRVSRSWFFPDRRAATIAFLGTRSEDGRGVDALAVTPEGGREFTAFVDHTTHLLYRTDEQQAEDRVVTTYSDYRAVHGVLLPFTVRVGDGGDPASDQVETTQTVEVNAALRDDMFSIPPTPKADIELPAGRDSVDVPFTLTSNNRVIVPMTVDGRKTIDAELDSGGSLILGPDFVAQLGITISGRAKTSGGGEGSTTAASGNLDSIALGDARVRGLAFESFAVSPGSGDRAIVGLELLQRFVVRLDFDRRVMTLTRPDAFAYAGTGAVVPFHFQDNQPEIRGAVDGIAGLFAIDTGDNGSLLLIAPFARRYGLTARYHADIPYDGHSIGATHGVWARTRAQTVTFDGPDGRPVAEVHDPVTRISLQHAGFDANRNVSANIGLGILREFNLTFDYMHQRLILERNRLYGAEDVGNRTGLRLTRQDAVWAVAAVYPSSPASEAGLQVGDVIERVDGRSADALTPDELAAKLKGPLGSKLRLDVRSGTARRQPVLTLRDVF